jgi:hypothetical protein
MDPVTLTAFLAPFLPALLNLGSKVAAGAATKAGETAGTQLAANALDKAKAIWEKLRPKVEEKQYAKDAAEGVAKAPDDDDLKVVLRVELKKILEADPELAEAIAHILQSDAPDGTSGTQIVQNVVGNQNQVIGQISGGTVMGNITGNVNLPGN